MSLPFASTLAGAGSTCGCASRYAINCLRWSADRFDPAICAAVNGSAALGCNPVGLAGLVGVPLGTAGGTTGGGAIGFVQNPPLAFRVGSPILASGASRPEFSHAPRPGVPVGWSVPVPSRSRPSRPFTTSLGCASQ